MNDRVNRVNRVMRGGYWDSCVYDCKIDRIHETHIYQEREGRGLRLVRTYTGN